MVIKLIARRRVSGNSEPASRHVGVYWESFLLTLIDEILSS